MKTYIKEILTKRKSISELEYVQRSKDICQAILSLEEYRKAENVLAFYPYSKEADILPVVLNAFSDGKNVFFPKVTGETTMEFVKVISLEEFSDGYKGIKEPLGEIYFDKVGTKEKTCMLVPGSVFDKHGNRCGYGKGYYDRYLADCHEKIFKIGVCFSIQMMDEISDMKKTDIPMDYVINEKESIRSDK